MASQAELLERVSALLGRRDLSQMEFANWAAGAADGGPDGDGCYPLSDSTGFVRKVPSPERVAAQTEELLGETNSLVVEVGAKVKTLAPEQFGPVPEDAGARLNDTNAAAVTQKRVIELEPRTYRTSATVNFAGGNDTLAGARGAGGGRTIVSHTGGNEPAVAIAGRYGRWGGFTAKHEVSRTTFHTNAPAMRSGANLTFSMIEQMTFEGGYHGLERVDGVSGTVQREFNNWWCTFRVLSWKHTAFKYGAGSGSVRVNFYASAIFEPSVLRGFECGDFSGEHIRINIERTTFRDHIFRLVAAHDVSFWGVHFEENSIIGRGFNPGRNEGYNPCFVYWTGAGITRFKQWTIDSSHFGPIRIKALSIVGTTATALLSDYHFQQKRAGGCGLRGPGTDSEGNSWAGDTIYVDGAADAALVGRFVVSAVNPLNLDTPEGRNTIQFEVPAGLPANPEPADNADCMTVNLGPIRVDSVPFFYLDGAADQMILDSVHLRDIFRGGATEALRRTMLRLAGFGPSSRGRVWFKQISTGGQRSAHSHWLQAMAVVGWSRTAGVVRLWFNRRHQLRADTVLNLQAVDPSINGRVIAGLTPGDLCSVTFPNAGPDVPLTRAAAGANAIMETAQIALVRRENKHLIITTVMPHGMVENGEVAVRFANIPSANRQNALILDVPTPSTIVLRDAWTDLAEITDGGSLMLIEGGLSVSALTSTSSPMGGIVEFADYDRYTAISPTRSIAPGQTLASTETVQSADPTRDRVRIISVIGADPRLVYTASVTAANTVQIAVTNPLPAKPAWTPNTPYFIGQTRQNGSILRNYVCVANGTSGTTGPLGIGNALSDGGATWAFDSPADTITSGNVVVVYELIRG